MPCLRGPISPKQLSAAAKTRSGGNARYQRDHNAQLVAISYLSTHVRYLSLSF